MSPDPCLTLPCPGDLSVRQTQGCGHQHQHNQEPDLVGGIHWSQGGVLLEREGGKPRIGGLRRVGTDWDGLDRRGGAGEGRGTCT